MDLVLESAQSLQLILNRSVTAFRKAFCARECLLCRKYHLAKNLANLRFQHAAAFYHALFNIRLDTGSVGVQKLLQEVIRSFAKEVAYADHSKQYIAEIREGRGGSCNADHVMKVKARPNAKPLFGIQLLRQVGELVGLPLGHLLKQVVHLIHEALGNGGIEGFGVGFFHVKPAISFARMACTRA